jgi:hypothetical protein
MGIYMRFFKVLGQINGQLKENKKKVISRNSVDFSVTKVTFKRICYSKKNLKINFVLARADKLVKLILLMYSSHQKYT